jgi:hypothetical protein
MTGFATRSDSCCGSAALCREREPDRFLEFLVGA